MKRILSGFILLCMLSSFAYASEYSDWAEESINIAYTGALIDEERLEGDFTAPITREEIAELAVLAYENSTGETAEIEPAHFTDTDSEYASAAYRLGIMNGTGDETFSPDDVVTREQMAKIIISLKAASDGDKIILTGDDVAPYTDFDTVSDWAKPYVALAYELEIVNGYEDLTYRPSVTVSWEQAIALIVRSVKINKVYDTDIKPALPDGDEPSYELKLEDLSNSYIEPQTVRIFWERRPEVFVYAVKVTQSRNSYYEGDIAPRTTFEYDIRRENYFDIELNANRNYKIEVTGGAHKITKEFYTYKINNDDAVTILENYPTTQAEAEALMVDVTVPVWRLSGGEKVSGEATLTVHNAIAEKVRLVFEEIYNGDEKFPIKDIGGYAWRGGRSEHNGGTAIDINYNENYCIYENGTTIGAYWKPYEDEYSITPYGDVVNAFEKYGFTWGGDAWRNPKDYMHFSYLGT